VTAYNFIRIVFTDIMPIFMIFLIIVFSADSISGEADAGTCKLLLIQPIGRNRIVLSKILAYSIICLGFFAIILSVLFFGLGLLFGFGSADYPTLFYTGTYIGFGSFC
jgi:ABC-type transport system involved in multi-copper enzyme maturation permease subunit